MAFMGSDWNDDFDDDSPIGISSSMKEYIREMHYFYEDENTMSKEKFTPGEWTVHEFYHEYSKQNLYNIYWSKDGEEVAERIYTKADAHLMSASKEMYECICDALTDLQMPSGMRSHFEAVLKKARGEE